MFSKYSAIRGQNVTQAIMIYGTKIVLKVRESLNMDSWPQNLLFMQQDKTIVLQTFSDLMEAKAMQNKLNEHGITSSLTDENMLGMDPILRCP